MLSGDRVDEERDFSGAIVACQFLLRVAFSACHFLMHVIVSACQFLTRVAFSACQFLLRVAFSACHISPHVRKTCPIIEALDY